MVGIDTTMKEYKDVIKRTVVCTKTSFYMQCVYETYSLSNIYVSIMSWAVSILFITSRWCICENIDMMNIQCKTCVSLISTRCISSLLLTCPRNKIWPSHANGIMKKKMRIQLALLRIVGHWQIVTKYFSRYYHSTLRRRRDKRLMQKPNADISQTVIKYYILNSLLCFDLVTRRIDLKILANN